MSWAITKKAINSDLSKPLNELIESESKAINSDLSKPLNELIESESFDWGKKTPTLTTMSTTNTNLTTVIEVQGSGVAVVAIRSSSSNAVDATARITVDGVVIDNTTGNIARNIDVSMYGTANTLAAGSSSAAPVGNWGRVSIDNVFGHGSAWIGFKQSFKYEVKRETSTNVQAGAVVIS